MSASLQQDGGVGILALTLWGEAADRPVRAREALAGGGAARRLARWVELSRGA